MSALSAPMVPPRHVFLIGPSPALTEWMAIARVRYNTPNQAYEQVDVIVYEDNDNYVKCHYESGGAVYTSAPGARPLRPVTALRAGIAVARRPASSGCA